ncbi:hypothetical protein BDL97_12G111900 [Sphagnum fallax]|nr:hypothetical protein BDL97_12G111900 [Sphagnum fallax]
MRWQSCAVQRSAGDSEECRFAAKFMKHESSCCGLVIMLEQGIHAHITFISAAGPRKKAHRLDRRVLRFGVIFNIWIHLFVLQNFEKDRKQGPKVYC